LGAVETLVGYYDKKKKFKKALFMVVDTKIQRFISINE